MGIVHEHLDRFPFTEPPMVLERREELLIGEPLPIRARALRDHGPLEVVHVSPEYVDRGRTHPRGLFQSDALRMEVQTMTGRQGFYHRNADVEEFSYQVAGRRALITELGTITHTAGDFSRIPTGVAHDNLGEADIHLLFYSPGPVVERVPATRFAEYLETPFPGWEPAVQNEMITEMRGGQGEGIHVAPADERLLIDRAARTDDRIRLVRWGRTAWLYETPRILIGQVVAEASDGRVYHRHLDADEIQYQVEGVRTLVTQRGAVELVPGDLVRIPRGVAFTGVHRERSVHLAVATAEAMPQVAEATKKARAVTPAELEALR
ncbi:hypothetical protein [Actinomadura verrucosospora]|uniref:Homogentisate 1,2-dioxygenase n=1 Tax=Actinomadura verrucosospora TaxID=46165 RepID=A0A7D4ACD1_ACTVE|nr:hypothetical protein [Actinomadura verrucosospora]QKG27067.1 homogentisate 1,2-dioxygenase [Actinomadura verrucosospora]